MGEPDPAADEAVIAAAQAKKEKERAERRRRRRDRDRDEPREEEPPPPPEIVVAPAELMEKLIEAGERGEGEEGEILPTIDEIKRYNEEKERGKETVRESGKITTRSN